MRTKLSLAAAAAIGAAALTTVANAGGHPRVRLVVTTPAIDLYHSAPVRVSGTAARSVDVRLVGANDRSGLAYQWAPYRWRALRIHGGTWRGLLPAPPLFGIYRLQIRLDHSSKFLSSTHWLLRVFPSGTLRRSSFPTAAAAIRDFVSHLRGHQVLVALRRWPQAKFDRRDPRLNRLFAIAYAPRDDSRPDSRLGLFVTTVRNGFHGRWRVLEASTQPYD